MLTEAQRQSLNWAKMTNLLPAIVQHAVSGEVLMLGYMNPAALTQTEATGLATFWSRSRQQLWTKGETSGNQLAVRQIAVDCDGDALLVLAVPTGPTCHRGTRSCFGESQHDHAFLGQLEQCLRERKQADTDHSYTARLYASGTRRIAQKVAEEGAETALAAAVQDRTELVSEAADLLYHLLVLLQDQERDLADVIAQLKRRHEAADSSAAS